MGNFSDKIFYYLSRPKFLIGLARAQLFYKFFFGSIGKKTMIISPELIASPSKIFIGKNVIIHPGARILCITDFHGQKQNPKIKIGSNVKIQQGLHMTCGDEILIQDGVTIAQNVGIFDIDHNFEDITKPIHAQGITAKKIVIGENSFIGKGAVIMGGSIIGKNCVVAANSVVRGEFPDYCVLAGSPAKIIKKYCPTEKIFKKIKETN